MLTKLCEQCGKDFFVYKSTARRRINCSRKCNYLWQKGKIWYKNITKRILWKCKGCGKEKVVPPSVAKLTTYCSHQCATDSIPLKGYSHPNWKGGISSKNKIERDRFRKSLQKTVFERDNYTCQLCGDRGVALQVDHIQSWADYVELRFNIENCSTLCQKCHYQITFGKPMPPTVRAWGHNFSKGGAE